jgi:hypothetical protein
MIDSRYLYLGLCGLARAHLASPMAGHLGAALLAGYFFAEEHPDLDPAVYAGVERDLDRVVAGEESLWFDAEAAGITISELFAPFPPEPAATERIESIATALSANIQRTREAGHNVIFASLAIRGLAEHPEHATPSIVDGICRLIRRFDRASPGPGYYGKKRGWIDGDAVTLSEDAGLPPYADERAMVRAVIGELVRGASVRRQGFGGLFHVINHAQAITLLSQTGHGDLARRGLAAHHHHLQLYRSLPDVEAELGALVKARHDPRTPEHWSRTDSVQWSAWLTHRIKTLYAFLDLLPMVEHAETRREAEDAFRVLMA